MRYILLFIHALTITIYHVFFGDPVTVSTNIPDSVKPGGQFLATITVKKGTLSGFAKLQVELPEGMTAEESDSKGGTFSTTGQTAKIIWTSIPSTEEVEVKMLITVQAPASGDKVIQGKYSYIDNNVKQSVEFTPVTVKIASEGGAVTTNTTAPTETVAATSNDTTPKPFTKPEETPSAVSAVRNITEAKVKGEYEVELRLKKDGVKGFAKVQEKIPGGYMAVGQKTEGATFSFNSSDYTAKFIFTSLPSQDELVLTYKLMPKQGVPQESPAAVSGEFSYLENQATKKYTIERQELPGQPAVASTNTTTTTEPANTNTTTPTNTVATTEPANTNTTTTTEPANTNTVATTEPAKTKNAAISFVVQVGAFKNGVNVNALSAKYSLSGVRTEMHEGYTKCLVGKHDEYKQARDAREVIKGKGVSDAFVAAYNSATRISVQEALMITSQKWYR
jgi:cell division septation protein DedD